MIGTPDPVLAGGTLTYTLVAHNAGPAPATNVVVTDVLPPNTTYVSGGSPQGRCFQRRGVVTCIFGALVPGADAAAAIIVTPTQSGALTNAATVSGRQSDPNGADNTATTTTTVSPAADLSVRKTVATRRVTAGAPLVYIVTVRNNGPGAASGIVVTDPLPSGETLNSAPDCTNSANVVTCDVATLAPGESAGFTITVTPTAGTYTNTASVAAASPDPDMANNSAGVTTRVR